MDYWPAGKGWGDWGGEVAHSPPPAGAEGQRGRNGEAGCPSRRPAHSSFSYRFYKSASEARAVNTHWFREGKAGEGISDLRWKLLLCPGRARSEHQAGSGAPCFTSHLAGDVEGKAVSLFGPRFPHLTTKGLE